MELTHVGINAVFLEPGMGGLEVLTRSLLSALVRTAPNLRISVFVNRSGYDHLVTEPWAADVELITRPWLGRRPLRALSELTLLGSAAPRAGVQLLHSVAMTAPLRTKAVNVVTVNDVIWLTHPTPEDRVTTALWRLIGPPVARRADRVLAISNAAKRDIVTHLGVDADRIDVVYPGHGVPPTARPTPERALRERHGLGAGPLVLTVSAKRSHKNLERLVRCLPRVLERVPDATLVLPGAPTEHEQELRGVATQMGASERVAFLGFVDAEDLEGLYAAAACCVQPSLNEGFGLPVQEAQRRSTPVACSNTSALPEAGGDGARYFDPTSEAAIAGAILDLLENPALVETLVAAGRAHQARFTWERSAQLTLEAYERAWAERHG